MKNAASQIREMIKSQPKIVHSQNLLQNVINLFTFFKYKHESRKSIMNIFEEFIKSAEFINEKGGKVQFYLFHKNPKPQITGEQKK